MADDMNGWGGNGNGTLFANVRILDATGDYPYTGEVLVQGNRIKQHYASGSIVASAAARRPTDRA